MKEREGKGVNQEAISQVHTYQGGNVESFEGRFYIQIITGIMPILKVPLPLPGEGATISCPHSYPLFMSL